MRHGHRTFLLAIVCTGAAATCEDVTAPEAARVITELEERIARGWIADPTTFPDADPVWAVAHLIQHGAGAVPVTITIDGTALTYRALAYESAYDPFVLTGEGQITVWRRGLVAWRGDPAEDVLVVWARAPGPVERPKLLLDPGSELATLFARRRAYRVRRDSTSWSATEGAIAVGDPVPTGPCRFDAPRARARKTRQQERRPLTCVDVVFDASFDLVFERRDPRLDHGRYMEMLEKQLPSLPVHGTARTTISLAATRIPGIRFVQACGRVNGAPNDSTCLSIDGPPSP
jgi:hypothetical protein